jgi:hypothetical protein
MATTTIQAAAVNASADAWTLGAGADKVVAVNSPDDDDTTHVRATAQNQVQGFTLAAHSIPANAVISAISLVMRVRRDSTTDGSIAGRFTLGGTTVTGSTVTTTSAYVDVTQTLARPGGGNWTVADLASLSAEIIDNHGARRSRITTMYVSVGWNAPQATRDLMFLLN